MRENYPVLGGEKLLKAFNEQFNCKIGMSALKQTLKRKGIKSGRTGYFEKGHKPWNTGTKGLVKPNSGQFKKGSIPRNRKPFGHERPGKDGYIEMKVPEQNPYTGVFGRYKFKHVWLWERENGPRPKDSAIIFKDGNNRNFSLDNLECVTRAELLCLNRHRYKKQPAELKPSVLALSKLEAKAGFIAIPSWGKGSRRRKKKEE